jgi:hypothetical protein
MTRLTPKKEVFEEGDYDIDYRKPPVSTRFPKGTSGNPKGRPKATLDIETEFGRLLDEPVVVMIEGRPRTVTRRFRGVLRRVDRAIRGDKTAVRWLVRLIREIYPAEKRPAIIPVYVDANGKRLSEKRKKEILARNSRT